jgi:sec-independent protein translocase protein TatC
MQMQMTLMGHFRELKRRIVWSLVYFCTAVAAGFWIAPFLQDAIMAPITKVWADPQMIYTGIADGLSIEFSLAGLFALIASLPFFLWQMWAYVSPALRRAERKIAAGALVMSPVLFAAGAAFAYFALLPMMFRFFLSVGGDAALLPNMKNYLSFSIGILRSFGLAFQMPLVLILLNRAGIFSRRQIARLGRYAVVTIFVIAAVLTPPDIVSQVALALPLIALFALSFLFMK